MGPDRLSCWVRRLRVPVSPYIALLPQSLTMVIVAPIDCVALGVVTFVELDITGRMDTQIPPNSSFS